MATCYELRYTGKLPFRNKDNELDRKVKAFIKQASLIGTEADLLLQLNEIWLSSTYIKLYVNNLYTGDEVMEFNLCNNFTDELGVIIIEIEPDVFNVDFCVGNKNYRDQLVLLTILLLDYMDSDFILILYDGMNTYKLDKIKESIDKYDVGEKNYIPSIYSLMNVVDCSYKRLADESDERYCSDWLHGLLADYKSSVVYSQKKPIEPVKPKVQTEEENYNGPSESKKDFINRMKEK